MTPPEALPRITEYQHWLQASRGLRFDTYDELWRWSTTDLRAFWQSIWDWFDIESPTPHRTVLEAEVMPGAKWFPGAQVNYARQVLRHADAAHAAGTRPSCSRTNAWPAPVEVSWPELRRQVGCFAARLREAGVAPGDRVCAVLPNTPHDRGRLPGHRQPGRGVVGVFARHGPGGGARPLPPDRTQGAGGGGRPGLGRCGARPPAGAARGAGRAAVGAAPGAAGRRGHLGTRRRLRRAGRQGHDFADWVAGDPGAYLQTGSPSGCPSTTRCGWCIPAAPPACPSPSCTATAASCWRCSRAARCTTTCAPPWAAASVSTGSAPPAGSCGMRSSARCWAAPRSACTTATPAGPAAAHDWGRSGASPARPA